MHPIWIHYQEKYESLQSSVRMQPLPYKPPHPFKSRQFYFSTQRSINFQTTMTKIHPIYSTWACLKKTVPHAIRWLASIFPIKQTCGRYIQHFHTHPSIISSCLYNPIWFSVINNIQYPITELKINVSHSQNIMSYHIYIYIPCTIHPIPDIPIQISRPIIYNNHITRHTLWLFNIAMEHGPFIDDFPS